MYYASAKTIFPVCSSYKYFCSSTYWVMIQSFAEDAFTGQFKGILVFHIITDKVNQELTCLLLTPTKLERNKVEYNAFVILMGLKNQPAAKFYSLQDI